MSDGQDNSSTEVTEAAKAKTTATKTTTKKKAAPKKDAAAKEKTASSTTKAAPKKATTKTPAKTTSAKKTTPSKTAASTKASKKIPALEQYIAVGRRKTATARVYMRPGKGNITVNGKELAAYFGRETACMMVRQPLVLLEVMEKFDIVVNVSGSGISGQAGAVRHGITRALLAYAESHQDETGSNATDAEESAAEDSAETATLSVGHSTQKRNTGWRLRLRKAGFVTRDARKVERKKVGKPKARRSKQFSKR